MINLFFTKLFGSMPENRISKWVQGKGKHAKGQADLDPSIP
jgi:hypothetical protein